MSAHGDRATPPSDHGHSGALERSSPALALAVPPELVEALAVRVVELLADRLPADRDGYLDADGAADYLACSRQRVYDLVHEGRLSARRDGRRLLFTRADLDGALDGPEPSA